MNAKSQNEALYKYLLNHRGITTWEAVDKLGITSLSRRVCDLKSQGILIKKQWLSGKNRYGNPTRVIRYSLE